MHHHRMGGHGYSQIDGVNGENHVLEHDYTWNMKYSARCNSGGGFGGDGGRKRSRIEGTVGLKQCLPRPDDT